MTDMPEDDLEARFRLDQEEAKTEQETRDLVVWNHQQRDAQTTMDQREAVTARVKAQADLLGTLNVVLWIALLCAVGYLAGVAVGAIAGVLR